MKSNIQDIISNEKHNRVESCSSSPCCRTEAMTTATSPSNSSSEEVKVGDKILLIDNNDKPLSEVIANCLICFWPMHNMDVGDEQEPQPRNDCFVAVNGWHDHHASSSNTFHEDTPADNSTFYQTEQNTTTDDDDVHVIRTLPLHHQSTGNNCKLLLDNNNNPARRLTPTTIQTQSRSSLTEKNGATLMSNNTLHRRTGDISVDFFTNQTLDEIHDSGGGEGEDGYQIGTPRCQQQQQNNHHVVYQTPGNRVRIDSESFRRTIKVVTCEKRRISDESDVSPIASDTGFNLSPMIDYTKHKRVAAVESVENLLSSQSAGDSPQKRLVFDKEEGWVVRLSDASPPDDHGGGDDKSILVHDNGSTMPPESSSPLSPISEFGMSVMKSLQSIIQGGGSRLTSSPVTTPSSYTKKNDDVSRHTPTSTRTDEQQPWQDCFLPKSSTFLKALRRSGRRGKVLIQGWVAFRENNNNLSTPAWKEIIRNPQRCDFRYIILLDDMPTLHIFSSRRKQKKKKKMVVVPAMQSKPDVLRDCIHLNLSTGNEEELAVRVNFISKELGNEVCIFEKETGVECYSFLPIPIPSNVFVDKHRSRLAKGEVLKSIFERCMSSSVLVESPSNADANVMDSSKSTMRIDYLRASVQQYDVSRHLLFVLDTAIFAANHDNNDAVAAQ